MPKFERLSTFPLDRQPGELFRQSMAARAMLERVWDDRTAFQGITLQPDDVPSRGQCGVSSVWYARHLEAQGIDARVTEGKIYVRRFETGDDHVWVEVHDVTETPLIIDLTSDQYRTPFGATVHMGTYDNSDGIVGKYTPEVQFLPYEVPRKKLMARFALMQENIAHLPRRQQLRAR
jgi:hypothetical protein